jgi:hypothetical protein
MMNILTILNKLNKKDKNFDWKKEGKKVMQIKKMKGMEI